VGLKSVCHMTLEIGIVLGIILLAIVLFIWEKFSVDTVAILVMVAFMVTGILTPSEGFGGFSNSATLTVGAMFVISAAVFKSGMLNNVSTFLIRVGRVNYTLCLLAIMLIAGLLSAFINDTAVVALLMPVMIQVAKEADISPSKLLMPLSFGALMGGVCTLIGTSTNILVSGILEEQGLGSIGMFEMTEAGIWFLLAGTMYMVVAGQFIIPSRKANASITDEFDMGHYLAEIKLMHNSKSVGTTIEHCPLVKDLDIEILQVIRSDGSIIFPMPYTELIEGDVLKVRCDVDKVKQLAVREGIKVKGDMGELEAGDIQLYETVIVPNSPFVGRSLADIQFKETYRGASVLAIRSRKNIIHEKIGHTKLRSGDILLVRSEKKVMRRMVRNQLLLVISEMEQKKLDWRKIIITLFIVIGVMVTAALEIVPILLSAAVGVVALILTGMIKPEEAYKSIEWKVLFMLAGVLSMGVALQKTGAAQLLGDFIIHNFGEYGPHIVLSFFFALSFLLTNVMSNNATAALLAPIAIVSAQSMDVSIKPFVLAITFAASLSFMTPIGYQTNTMIYAPGNYKFRDYLKVGTPLNILLWILATIILPLIYPF
jgi:di/tricarboxylate transporter